MLDVPKPSPKETPQAANAAQPQGASGIAKTWGVWIRRRLISVLILLVLIGAAGFGTWTMFLRPITVQVAHLQSDAAVQVFGLLFFLHGTGANGKSVLMSTVAGILAEYHMTTPTETFVASNVERHPTELARLRGARLVTATETEEGRAWAEAKIKALTGGDRISARFMRQDFFEFTPTFKLLIAGNHKPGLRSVDEAMRRRLHLVPFAVTIPPEERDLELAEKLKAEWPGILAWMIEGCARWQQTGLQRPEAVRASTESYLDAEDAIGAWIDECCERDPQAWETRAALFASWSVWAIEAREPVGDNKSFVRNLEARGFRPQRKNAGRGFCGLKIK